MRGNGNGNGNGNEMMHWTGCFAGVSLATSSYADTDDGHDRGPTAQAQAVHIEALFARAARTQSTST